MYKEKESIPNIYINFYHKSSDRTLICEYVSTTICTPGGCYFIIFLVSQDKVFTLRVSSHSFRKHAYEKYIYIYP